MHSANLDTSKRLQAVYEALEGGKERSTMELIWLSGRVAINSIVSELRDNGIDISCQRRGKAWYYTLRSER
jgi:hypothetical protein